MKKIRIETAHLVLSPKTEDEMEAMRRSEPVPELQAAYGEMLAAMRALPGQEEWGAAWTIALPDGTPVGSLCFMGPADKNGCVELGYGIDEAYRRRGYATEAAAAITKWALAAPGVRCVQAQADPENHISQKVLAAAGFVRDGMGEEGPLFKAVR